MDYTPVTFSDKVRQGVPAIRKTTMGHQLALAVVFESGFQCFADKAESYLSLPEQPKQFLKEVPAAWDESVLLAGYPADYAVVARRSGDVWYIGGISGKEEEREIEFTLPAGCEGKSFTMIIDGKDKDSFDYMPVENTNGIPAVLSGRYSLYIIAVPPPPQATSDNTIALASNAVIIFFFI